MPEGWGLTGGFQSGEDHPKICFGSRLPQIVVFSVKISLVIEHPFGVTVSRYWYNFQTFWPTKQHTKDVVPTWFLL